MLVFSELAPVFTALIDARPRANTAAELAADLAPVLALLGSGEDGATALEAFGAYGQALYGPADRADLVLRANTLAVSHEQRRLQPAISAALDAAISDTLKKLIEADLVRHLPTDEARHALDGLTDELCKVLDEAWDTTLTEAMMRFATATETLDLRRDVPPLAGGAVSSRTPRADRDPSRSRSRAMGPHRRDGHAVGCPRLGCPRGAHELHRESLPLPPMRREPVHPSLLRHPAGRPGRRRLPPGPL